MCGRYTLSSKGDELALMFDLTEVPAVVPRYNLAPTQEAAVVRVERAGAPRHLDLLRWGLIPYWAKEASIGNRMINARSESVAEKPSFRAALRYKRCLVPCDGFYEWTGPARARRPHMARPRDGGLMGLAAIYENWLGADGSEIETMAILTTASNGAMAALQVWRLAEAPAGALVSRPCSAAP